MLLLKDSATSSFSICCLKALNTGSAKGLLASRHSTSAAIAVKFRGRGHTRVLELEDKHLASFSLQSSEPLGADDLVVLSCLCPEDGSLS